MSFCKPLAAALAGCMLLTGVANVYGADVPADKKILAAKTFRASKITGLNVRNMQGEKLGTIDDFVVDVSTGKISYAALSVGGILGLGDKLFAVPYQNLAFDHGQDEMFFVLDMPKEKLQAAPGFDKSNWPNFADPSWSTKIDQYYQKKEVETRTKRTETQTKPIVPNVIN